MTRKAFFPQEDDLQHLQFFTHYGKLVKEEQGGCHKNFSILILDNYTSTFREGMALRSSSSWFGIGSFLMRSSLGLREGLNFSGWVFS